MRQERHVNDTESTLNGGISDSVTSLTLTDGSGFPSEGDFRLIIESELLLATARTGNVLTVERGIENTTPAAHADAQPVKVIVTEGALEQFWSDFAPLYMPDSTPPKRILDASGNPIDQSDFTWFNQGTATAEDLADGSILLTTPAGAGNNWRGKYVNAPSTPWTITAAFSTLWLQVGSTYPQCGIVVSDTTGTVISTHVSYHHRQTGSPGIQILRSTSYTTYNGSYIDLRALGASSDIIWLRYTNDGVDQKQYVSIDGVKWLHLYTAAYNHYLTNGGDQVGFGHDLGGNNQYSIDHFTYLKHWSWS